MTNPRSDWKLAAFAAAFIFIVAGIWWSRSEVVEPDEIDASFSTAGTGSSTTAAADSVGTAQPVASIADGESVDAPAIDPPRGVSANSGEPPCAGLPSDKFTIRDADGNIDCALLIGSRDAEPPELRQEVTVQQQQALFRQEPRDSAWAAPTEGRLGEAIARVGNLRISSMTVQCRTTVCAVELVHGDSMPLAEANRTVFRGVTMSMDDIALEHGLKDPHLVPESVNGIPKFQYFFSRDQ